MTMRSSRVVESSSKPLKSRRKSKSSPQPLKSTSRENQQTMRSPPSSSKEPKKAASRVKVLLGGVFDRFQKNSPSRGSLRVEDLAEATTTPTNKEDRDASQTTALTENDFSSRLVEDDASFVVSVRLLDGAENQNNKRAIVGNNKEKKKTAATLLQSLFRGYRQRYEYKFILLKRRLAQIEHNKQRQLRKLAQRSKVQKRREKSVFDFHYCKTSRNLQRNARIVPYLFREAQGKMQENMFLARTPQHLQELQQSHLVLQKIAHSYLESLEDVSGIWDALKSQWFGPKKPRPRRGFGTDGKVLKRPITVQRCNTQDGDLPQPPSVVDNKRSLVAKDTETPEARFQKLYREALALEQSATKKELNQAVEQVRMLAGVALLN